MTGPDTDADKQLAIARQAMARRKDALEQLADVEIAERIMEENREIPRALAKR